MKESLESPRDRGHHRRILLIMVLLGAAAFLPVALRLGQLMIREYDHYASLALRNQTRTTLVTADRGNIYDRNMSVLAASQSADNLYLDPRELQQAQVDCRKLSQDLGALLQKDPQRIYALSQDRTRRYHQIGARLPETVSGPVRAYINENHIHGVHLEPTLRRVYPMGSLAAQVIGFTDSSNQGVEGVELSWDSYLKGQAGQVVTTKGNNEMDMPFSLEWFRKKQAGHSLVLTLDTTVQQCLENRLRQAMDQYGVKNGAFGLVMNCKTGEILAMATLESYDPNDYQKIGSPAEAAALAEQKAALDRLPEDSQQWKERYEAYQKALKAAQLKQWRNRVISDGYEPGSTFKVLTMAAALDCGAIDLETDFYCRGAEQIPGRAQKLHCWRHQGHGAEKTPQALQNSCNLAFAHIALRLGGQRFYDYVQRFGILEKTGVDLMGESRGIFFDRALIVDTDKWGTASLTSGSFGQTFKLTPMQLVRAIASVVNGGLLPDPYVVAEVLDEQGNSVYHREPVFRRRTISQETSDTMRQLLRSVVTQGTARNAAVSGYSIGGKTGTSEKIDVFDENGRRVLDKIVSFVGVAPMDDPQYIVLAALDTPSRDCGTYLSGGAMAAPTVGKILGDILPYLEVRREDGPSLTLPRLTGLPAEEARSQLRQLGLTALEQGSAETVTDQLPGPGQKVSPGSQVLLYRGAIPGTVTVPDLRGMTLQQAAEAAGSLGLRVETRGRPDRPVSQQSIGPGTSVPPGTAVILVFTDEEVRD